jgi:hypothetical protein
MANSSPSSNGDAFHPLTVKQIQLMDVDSATEPPFSGAGGPYFALLVHLPSPMICGMKIPGYPQHKTSSQECRTTSEDRA